MFPDLPARPRYKSVWNVSTLLHWAQSLPPLSEISLKTLSLKLGVLMALSNADRSSDLQALDLKFRTFVPGGVEFAIPGLTKTRRAGHPPCVTFYAEFHQDTRLCPVTVLREYERRTGKFRRDTSETVRERDPLSFLKPFKPVTSTTIARWLKNAMSQAEIDTSVFKAHSTRAASASAASHAEASMREIMGSVG